MTNAQQKTSEEAKLMTMKLIAVKCGNDDSTVGYSKRYNIFMKIIVIINCNDYNNAQNNEWK